MAIKPLPKKVVWQNSMADVKAYSKACLKHIMVVLKMRDYDARIYVRYDPESEDNGARVVFNDKYTFSNIFINYGKIDTIEELQKAILHECIHCSMHEADTACRHAEALCPEQFRENLKALLDKGQETSTKRLTEAIFPMLGIKHLKPRAKLREQ